MKWLSFFVIIFVVMKVYSPPAALSGEEQPVVIQSISHSKDSENKEIITFALAAAVSPKIFTMDGGNPRLVIDFPQSVYYGKNSISLSESVFARSIRIGLHTTPVQRTRVVIDLAKGISVKYVSNYSEQDNTLTVVLTADSAKVQTDTASKRSSQSPVTQQIKEKITVQPPAENPELPVPPVKKETAVPASESNANPGKPELLEVSFDDSSSRGEMVLFRLNDFYPPTVSAIENDTPRVLCDFMAMNLGPDVQQTILAKGKYIERIRTAMHHDPESVRVVLDLSPDRDYDLQQVFFRNDNLFVLIVNELSAKQDTQ